MPCGSGERTAVEGMSVCRNERSSSLPWTLGSEFVRVAEVAGRGVHYMPTPGNLPVYGRLLMTTGLIHGGAEDFPWNSLGFHPDIAEHRYS